MMDFSKYEMKTKYPNNMEIAQQLRQSVDLNPYSDEFMALVTTEYNKQLISYENEYNATLTQFKNDMENELGYSYLPQCLKDKLYTYGYENGYIYGCKGIYDAICDVCELVIYAYEQAGDSYAL